MSNAKLLAAAQKALKDGVEGPRNKIGMMCHHMVLDLLERAKLVKMKEARGGGYTSGQAMAADLWARSDDPEFSGDALKNAIKNERGSIIALSNPAQSPAHSVVALGDGKVAGFNNVGSTDYKAGLKYCWFYFSQFKAGYTYKIVDAKTAADRLKARVT
jgi:hypothetical protein